MAETAPEISPQNLRPRASGDLKKRAIDGHNAKRCCEEGMNRLEKNMLSLTSQWTEMAIEKGRRALGLVFEEGTVTLALVGGGTLILPTTTPVIVAAPAVSALPAGALVLGSAIFLGNAYGALVATQTLTDCAAAIVRTATKTRSKLWDCEACIRKRMFDQRIAWNKKPK